MGAPFELPVTTHNAGLIEQMLEAARRVERMDTLHALARYLNAVGEHEAAQILRTDPHVFRWMRKSPR